MDPQETWEEMAEAYGDDWERAAELADALLHWLERGGFPPEITGNHDFDRMVANATCQAVPTWDVV